ncbi:MAG: ROK family transcriptional regulator [Clostridiales bacterium]|nr:ROK family transcriptional regulator [Clostridiales bacterium]
MADRSASRAINQKAIIDLIIGSGGISKARIAKELGISKPAVSSNVSDLIKAGVLLEEGEGEAAKSGGRKPILIRVNERFKYVGAVDLSFRDPVCAVCDLRYQLAGLGKVKAPPGASPAERRRLVGEAFDVILRDASVAPDKLGAIVISQPGVIKGEAGEHFSKERHHAWTEIALPDFLQERYATGVYVVNDVNLAAVGETRLGLKTPPGSLIYVMCGVGLGAGIVIDGKLYEGVGCAAGEIGYSILPGGGSAEDVIAMDGLIKRARRLTEADETLTFERIVALAKDGDETVRRAIFETGFELGRLIYNCVLTLDIPTVAVGGEYLELGQSLFDGIDAALAETTFRRPEVIPSALMSIAGLCGGFVYGADKIFKAFEFLS